MALRRASAAERLEPSAAAPAAVPLPTPRVLGAGAGTGGAAFDGAELAAAAGCPAGALRTSASPRERLGAEDSMARLPAPDKAFRLASASARPLVPGALLCCVMTSPVYFTALISG
jgi:hypothetical protein